METKAVYKAIAAVQGEMAKIGISKGRENSQQGYCFRGIDDIYNALAPLLSKHSLCLITKVGDRQVVERTSSRGTAMFYVTVSVEFDIVSAVDGSIHTAKVCGEAMDSGDKATNKAMSAAYKYLCLQVFCIPTEGDHDTENHTHEVKAKKPVAARSEAKKGANPMTYIGEIGDVTKGVSPTGKNYVRLMLDGKKCYIAKGSPEEAESDCEMFGNLMTDGVKIKAELKPAGANYEITKIGEA